MEGRTRVGAAIIDTEAAEPLMPIQGRVRHGTTPSERLCDTCSHSFIYQGEDSREHVHCTSLYKGMVKLTTTVVRCNRYNDKRDVSKPDLHDMKDMAFILTQDVGPLKSVGFVSPRDWKKKHKDDEVVPPGAQPFFD